VKERLVYIPWLPLTGVLRPVALGVTGLDSGPFVPGVGGNGNPGSGEVGM
jgi:hypothetical protein